MKLLHGVSLVHGLRCPLSTHVPHSVQRPQTPHSAMSQDLMEIFAGIVQLKKPISVTLAPLGQAGRAPLTESHSLGHELFQSCAATVKREVVFRWSPLRLSTRSWRSPFSPIGKPVSRKLSRASHAPWLKAHEHPTASCIAVLTRHTAVSGKNPVRIVRLERAA
jgi:hypothetical protein